VLEGTDRAGARQLAERIRQEVGAQTHDSAKGPSGRRCHWVASIRGRQEQARADFHADRPSRPSTAAGSHVCTANWCAPSSAGELRVGSEANAVSPCQERIAAAEATTR